MLEKLKKKSIKKSWFGILVLFAIGVVLICLEFSNVVSLLHGRVQFETLEPDEINGSLVVDVSLDTNFGAYMEEYERNTKTNYTRTTDLYYVIWTGDAYAEDFKYMGIKVPASEENTMEDIAEATYYQEYIDPVTYSGAINKMSKEEYQYFKDYFIESGWSEEEIEEYTLPYYISVGALTGGSAVSVYVFLAIGIILVILAIWRFIFVMRGGCLKTIRKEMEEIGVSESELDYEYEGAKLYYKANDFRIGKRVTFFMLGSKAHVISNAKIVWAYQKNTTHRTNGIKTGTTYDIVYKTYERKNFQVSIPNEQTGQELLQYLNETMPWIVIGFDNDINNLYQKDYQNFLQLRYNQVPHDPYANIQQNDQI